MRKMSPVSDSVLQKVLTFILQPIPPGGSRFRQEWEARCRALPPETPDVLMETLSRGTPSEQEAAIVTLRYHNYEVIETGERTDRRYILRKAGAKEWEVIRPMLQLD